MVSLYKFGVAHTCMQRPQKDLGCPAVCSQLYSFKTRSLTEHGAGLCPTNPSGLLPQCPQDSGCRRPCSAASLSFPLSAVAKALDAPLHAHIARVLPTRPSSQPSSSLFNSQSSVQCIREQPKAQRLIAQHSASQLAVFHCQNTVVPHLLCSSRILRNRSTKHRYSSTFDSRAKWRVTLSP